MANDFELDDFDFGFTAVSEEDITNPAIEQVVSTSTDKAQRMYKMIMPLLKNLEKDADKNAYIHWPNRKEKIQQFIKKLDGLLAEK
jgi:hypothetical protein